MLQFFYYFTTILIYLSISSSSASAAVNTEKVGVTAQIPASANIKVFGYTSPLSIVQITGAKSYGQTNSDQTGYFQIEGLAISSRTTELCGLTIDRDRRIGFPVCFPVNPFRDTQIGPILLSPTLSVSANTIWQNQIEYAMGKTIPGQIVSIGLFETAANSIPDRVANAFEKLVHPQAFAGALPLLETTSDKEGYFSFSLPTAKAYTYRVFAATSFDGAATPKSPTISYSVGAISTYFARYVLPKIITIAVFLSIAVALFIYDHRTGKLRQWLKWFNEKKFRPFAVRLRLLLLLKWYNFRRYWRSRQSRRVRRYR